MDQVKLEELVDNRIDACHRELVVKGADYANRGGDRLSNFKMAAQIVREITGKSEVPITPGLVWLVYFIKHLVPIVKALVLDESLQSEALPGRFTDAINYLLLGEALTVDQQQELRELIQELQDESVGFGDSEAVLVNQGSSEDLPKEKPWLQTAFDRLRQRADAGSVESAAVDVGS